MPRAQDPVSTPVVITFDDNKRLESVIDSGTLQHSVICDRCGSKVDLGKRGSANPIVIHRDSQRCKRIVEKAKIDAAKSRNLVSQSLCSIRICS